MSCAGICYCVDTGTAEQAVIYEEAPQDDISEGASVSYDENLAEDGEDGAEKMTSSPALCYVHICGEVMSPGVYQLEEGSRVFQAVEAAGGLTEAAAQEYLNLAGLVEDGMKIVVLSKEEAEESGLSLGADPYSSADPAGSGKVNLNTAGKEELMTLNGIGESRAEDIIRYREEQGAFQTIEDIKKVPGIKEAAFAKIKDMISV